MSNQMVNCAVNCRRTLQMLLAIVNFDQTLAEVRRPVNQMITNNCRLADRAVYRAHLQPALSCVYKYTLKRIEIVKQN